MIDRILMVGKAGLQVLADGAEGVLRLGKEGQLIVGKGQADLYEAARSGRLFWGITAAAGVAPGTAIGTTAAFALANGPDSGVECVIHKLGMGYVSGTLGAGHVVAALGAVSATAVSGTAITEVAARGGSPGSRAKARTTATLPATPSAMFPVWDMSAADGTDKQLAAMNLVDIGGAIVVAQGANFSLQGVAGAGTSPLVRFACLWEEIPVGRG